MQLNKRTHDSEPMNTVHDLLSVIFAEALASALKIGSNLQVLRKTTDKPKEEPPEEE